MGNHEACLGLYSSLFTSGTKAAADIGWDASELGIKTLSMTCIIPVYNSFNVEMK